MNNIKENIINYCKDLFRNKKLWIIKLISFLCISFIIFLIFFLVRDSILILESKTKDFMGNFISIQVAFNHGVAFSMINDNIYLTYFIQIFFVLVFLLFAIFIKDIMYFVLFLVISLSGFCNIIDRALPDSFLGQVYNNTVVDYFKFKFIENSAIFNIADTFIVLGFIITFCYSIYFFFFKKKKDNNHEQ